MGESSEGAGCVLNHQAVSPGPIYLLLKCVSADISLGLSSSLKGGSSQLGEEQSLHLVINAQEIQGTQ